MSNSNGLFTTGTETFDSLKGEDDRITSIPLTNPRTKGTESLGTLVSDASSQISSLVRSEVELAKAELATEAKKGAIGGGFFGVAGAIALYSTFFFFIFIAELLTSFGLARWASYLIVFILMLVIAGAAAFFGYTKVKKIGAPKETIKSVTELKTLVPGQQSEQKASTKSQGMYS